MLICINKKYWVVIMVNLKEKLMSGTAVALVATFLTACASVNDNRRAHEGEIPVDSVETVIVEEQQQSRYSRAVEESLDAASQMAIPISDETISITPPFLPERHAEDATSTEMLDSTDTKSPFSGAVKKALEDAERAPEDIKDKISPPFIPVHDEPEVL